MPAPKKKTQAGPALKWDSKARRYRSGGRFVSARAVAEERNRLIETVQGKLRAISQDYVDGKISLVEWQIGFKDTIKAAHTLAAAIPNGGKANMTPAMWGAVGARLRLEYTALQRFAIHLENGGKMHLGRVDMYAHSIRNTWLNAERINLPIFQMARWVRGARESCSGCIYQASRGVQLLASFPPLGSQNCLSRCRCHIQYVKVPAIAPAQ